MSAGKGDRPRNNFSKQFQENFGNIKWGGLTNFEIDFLKRVESNGDSEDSVLASEAIRNNDRELYDYLKRKNRTI